MKKTVPRRALTGSTTVGRKPNTIYQLKHLIQTVKHIVGGIMIWACFVTTATGHYLPLIYQSILEWIVRSSVFHLTLQLPNFNTLKTKLLKKLLKKAFNSPLTDMLSPVPAGDWYMPRSTKVVKEDLPDALTKPLDWYWWSRGTIWVIRMLKST